LYCGGQADHYHLEQVPLEQYFPEYTGGSDINKAAQYILWKFMQANRTRLSVYPQYVATPFVGSIFSVDIVVSLTQATDKTNQLMLTVVHTVKKTTLENYLKYSRIL